MKNPKIVIMIISFLLAFTATGCHSFDADGYVKALLDNTYKGESTALINISKSSDTDVVQIYQNAIDQTCNELLEDVQISDALDEEYHTFVKDMLSKADYQVGSAIKNDDDSYTVTVITHRLDLTVNNAIDEETDAYISELQDKVNSGEATMNETELREQTYTKILQCYEDALAAATYEEGVSHEVQITLTGNTYNANESDLNRIAQDLFSIQ